MQQPPELPQHNPYAAPQASVADVQHSEGLMLADRGMRLAGAFIDGIILWIVLTPALFMSGYFTMIMSGQQPGFGYMLGLGLGSFIAFLLAQGYFLNRSGQTIAKKLLGMRIVDLNGNKPEFLRLAGLRYGLPQLISLLPVVNLIFIFVDALFIFREDRRCVHDLFAGTRVVLV
jgi:uncharacterized RDD family membrane protein YckC